MGNSVEFLIRKPMMTPNQFIHLHWAAKDREKQWWVTQVMEAKQIHGITDAAVKRKVIITRFGRKMDPDNLVASCKCLLDALTINGIIRDDSPDWIELEVKQRKANSQPHGPGTLVRIESLGGGE